jgi:hypothetical protein
MLRQHLATCQKWLDIPVNDKMHLDAYQKYTGFPDECKDPNVDDPGDTDDEVDLDGSETIDLVFLKWIRLQVNHWLALGIISRSFGAPSDPRVEGPSKVPSVSLLAVRYRKSCPVEPWRTTLKNLIGLPANPIVPMTS